MLPLSDLQNRETRQMLCQMLAARDILQPSQQPTCLLESIITTAILSSTLSEQVQLFFLLSCDLESHEDS